MYKTAVKIHAHRNYCELKSINVYLCTKDNIAREIRNRFIKRSYIITYSRSSYTYIEGGGRKNSNWKYLRYPLTIIAPLYNNISRYYILTSSAIEYVHTLFALKCRIHYYSKGR